MLATSNTRKATTVDIPFLARVEYEASLPPLNQSLFLGRPSGTSSDLVFSARL